MEKERKCIWERKTNDEFVSFHTQKREITDFSYIYDVVSFQQKPVVKALFSFKDFSLQNCRKNGTPDDTNYTLKVIKL